MANTKQAIKMVRKIKRRTDYNRSWKNKVRLAIKSLNEILIQEKPPASKKSLQKAYIKTQKRIDKAVKRGIIHKNKGSRMKSRISKRLVISK